MIFLTPASERDLHAALGAYLQVRRGVGVRDLHAALAHSIHPVRIVGVGHSGPAQRQLQHRQWHHGRQRAPLAAVTHTSSTLQRKALALEDLFAALDTDLDHHSFPNLHISFTLQRKALALEDLFAALDADLTIHPPPVTHLHTYPHYSASPWPWRTFSPHWMPTLTEPSRWRASCRVYWPTPCQASRLPRHSSAWCAWEGGDRGDKGSNRHRGDKLLTKLWGQ